MSGEDIERILADFRNWLTEQTALPDAEPSPAEPIDLATVVDQFAALRHEINLQTRATRAVLEQNAQLASAAPSANGDDTKSVLHALFDMADALTLSHRHSESIRDGILQQLKSLEYRSIPLRPAATPKGVLSRLFGGDSAADAAWQRWADSVFAIERQRGDDLTALLRKLQTFAASAADGYALSLRRIERLLPQLSIEPLACVGQPFDPESMEAVELVDGPVPGLVAEEVRRGYRKQGTVIRIAQVKVVRDAKR
jgi:molecular chaperone GrpE